ncbi:MAG: hypothetical protein WAL72_14975 [Streptosporangiaceae bacterium]
MKLTVSASLTATGLGLFVAALLIEPHGVTESVWTGIATGLFTTGLIELVLNRMRARERAEEMRRRDRLITPLDYHLEGNMLDLVLDNRSGEVAVYVVVGTHFPGDLGLMRTRAVERAFEWTSVTFDQAIQVLDSRELVGKLPWQSGRVPIVFTDIPPNYAPHVLLRVTAVGGSELPTEAEVEVPVRVEWSVPGDPLRYETDIPLTVVSGGTAN